MNCRESLICVQCYPSPCGELLLGSTGDSLCLCDWLGPVTRHERIMRRIASSCRGRIVDSSSQVIDRAVGQLDEYFSGRRRLFSLPLRLIGTDFQQRVWLKLLEIPYGSTVSYLQLASMLGCPGAVRAVANANGANPISIIVPCHRVIGSDGRLTGYGGTIPVKHRLLTLESSIIH